VADLLALVDPLARGDPQSPLRWTCKTVRTLAEQLKASGHSSAANGLFQYTPVLAVTTTPGRICSAIGPVRAGRA
jgi:hypothetical protein